MIGDTIIVVWRVSNLNENVLVGIDNVDDYAFATAVSCCISVEKFAKEKGFWELIFEDSGLECVGTLSISSTIGFGKITDCCMGTYGVQMHHLLFGPAYQDALDLTRFSFQESGVFVSSKTWAQKKVYLETIGFRALVSTAQYTILAKDPNFHAELSASPFLYVGTNRTSVDEDSMVRMFFSVTLNQKLDRILNNDSVIFSVGTVLPLSVVTFIIQTAEADLLSEPALSCHYKEISRKVLEIERECSAEPQLSFKDISSLHNGIIQIEYVSEGHCNSNMSKLVMLCMNIKTRFDLPLSRVNINLFCCIEQYDGYSGIYARKNRSSLRQITSKLTLAQQITVNLKESKYKPMNVMIVADRKVLSLVDETHVAGYFKNPTKTASLARVFKGINDASGINHCVSQLVEHVPTAIVQLDRVSKIIAEQNFVAYNDINSPTIIRGILIEGVNGCIF